MIKATLNMIKTKRLELIPLDARQLRMLMGNLPALEWELNCFYKAEPLEGEFGDIVRGQLAVTEKDPENYRWHSFWLIVRIEDRCVVGSANFKNVPDANGYVEIGYGLGCDFEHCGYMTEAVAGMCVWALAQDGVRHITAETETDNYASQKVLLRCGFTEASRGATVWWRL